MTDDRSERLRSKRKKASERARDQSDDKPVKTDKPNKPDKTDKTNKQDESEKEVLPVKERDDWGPVQIHIPDDLRDDLELAFDDTNLELRKDGEEKLEKLLHYYPLVVSAGIDAIEDMDVDEIRADAKRFE